CYLLEDIALSSRGQLTVTYCLSETPPSRLGGLRGRINKQIIKEWMNLMQSTFLLTPSKSQVNVLQSHSIRHDINIQSQNFSPTLEPQSPFMQPQPKLEPVFSAKNSKSLAIDPDLANAEESYGLLQRKIIVSGPS
ncbi:19549_t:CDS:2, partial [Gigaspora rosea]